MDAGAVHLMFLRVYMLYTFNLPFSLSPSLSGKELFLSWVPISEKLE